MVKTFIIDELTNRAFICHGMEQRATNGVLTKLSQIGTVTETVKAIERELGSMAKYESPFKSFEHTGETVEGASNV